MMRVGGKLVAGLAALLVAVPGVAHAADGLECMGQSYDAQEQAEMLKQMVALLTLIAERARNFLPTIAP